MGLIFNRDHHLLIAASVDQALTSWAENAQSQDEADQFLAVRDAAVGNISRQVIRDVHSSPEAVAALQAPTPGPGRPHPFLDWLMHGGGAWLYSIARIIAAMFGLPLPPLPPIPPPPPLPQA